MRVLGSISSIILDMCILEPGALGLLGSGVWSQKLVVGLHGFWL